MAKVKFIRRLTKNEIDSIGVEDGNFIITKDGGLYADYGDERIDLVPPIQLEVENIIKSLGLDANTYLSTSTYNVGDMVVYNHAIYECNTANTTGVWDLSKWTLVPIIKD